jgi:hypothetical protein
MRRAHVNWLQYGDRDTSFSTKHALNEGEIVYEIFKKGGWVVNEEEKKAFNDNHFA